MTTESDVYLEAVYEISESGCSDPECAGCLSYAAYLRERFVTREEYEAACRPRFSLGPAVIAALTADRDRLAERLRDIEALGSGRVVAFEPGPDASPDFICGFADGFRSGAKSAAGLATQALNQEPTNG